MKSVRYSSPKRNYTASKSKGRFVGGNGRRRRRGTKRRRKSRRRQRGHGRSYSGGWYDDHIGEQSTNSATLLGDSFTDPMEVGEQSTEAATLLGDGYTNWSGGYRFAGPGPGDVVPGTGGPTPVEMGPGTGLAPRGRDEDEEDAMGSGSYSLGDEVGLGNHAVGAVLKAAKGIRHNAILEQAVAVESSHPDAVRDVGRDIEATEVAMALVSGNLPTAGRNTGFPPTAPPGVGPFKNNAQTGHLFGANQGYAKNQGGGRRKRSKKRTGGADGYRFADVRSHVPTNKSLFRIQLSDGTWKDRAASTDKLEKLTQAGATKARQVDIRVREMRAILLSKLTAAQKKSMVGDTSAARAARLRLLGNKVSQTAIAKDNTKYEEWQKANPDNKRSGKAQSSQ